jgi:hypothetical protein
MKAKTQGEVTVMQYANRPSMSRWAAVAVLSGVLLPSVGPRCAAANAADSPPGELVTGAWQHHKLTFNYFGFTSLYTCDGLEDHVRQILVHLGARKDLTVTATGCPGPSSTPSPSAWVNTDFYSLAPATDAGGTDTVKARWALLEVTPQRPSFMGDGDCELVQQMKDLITKNFTLRDLRYRADCYPHEVTLNSFAIKAQALRPQAPKAGAVKG